MLNTVVIDDEPMAIELLETYIGRTPFLQHLGSFRNPFDGLNFVESHDGCVVFLDIHMPKLSGISLAKIVNPTSQIIFTTAYSEFAIESYELNAIDYLMKPVTFERFLKAVSKVERQMLYVKGSQDDKLKSGILSVKSGNQIHRVKTDEIIYLSKDHVYMTYHLSSKQILARESVTEALKNLGKKFLQIHKSYIVNIEKIEKVDGSFLYLGKDTRLPIGKAYKQGLLAIL